MPVVTATWNGATADWNTPADWSDGIVPNDTNTDVFLVGSGAYKISITSADPSFTVGALLLSDTGGVLSIGGTASLTVTGGFTNSGAVELSDIASLTLASGFTNSGGFRLDGQSSLTVTGGFTNNTGATLYVDTLSGDGGGGLKIGGTLANTGVVQFGNGNLGAATTVTLGGLTNASGASFSAEGSAGHALQLDFSNNVTGFTSNSGAVELSDIASLTLASGFTNSGGFRLDGQSSLTVTGGFTNNTGATLYVDTLSGDGGGGLKIGGTLANTGVVQFGNGNLGAATTVTLGGLTNASGASFSAEGSAGHALQLDFSNNVTGFTSNSGAVELSDIASLTLASGFTNSGGFRLDGQSSLTVTGGFTNNTGATLYVDTLSGDGGGGLKIGGTLANTGVVQFGNGNLGAGMTVALGGLTNASGASFSAEGSAGHALQLDFSNNVTGFTSNSGAVELSDIASLTLASGFTNSGGFRLDGQSSLTVTGGFTNNTGATLYVDTLSGDGGGGLKIGGTLANTGVVQFGNGNLGAATTVTLGGLTNASGASFSAEGSAGHALQLDFSNNVTGFTSNSGAVELSDIAPLTLASGFTNSGGFRLDGQSSLTVTGGFTNNTGATLYVDTLSGDGGGGLKIGGTLANSGAVQFGNTNLGAATTVTLGGLTNASGAGFSVFGSAGHALQLDFSNNVTGFTSNSGAVELSDIASLTLASGFTNSGGFRLDGQSSLTVTGGFTNNTGATLYVDTLSGDGGGGLKIAGTLANTGVVQFGNGNLGAATTVTLGGLTNASGASFSAEGSAGHALQLDFSNNVTGFTSNSGAVELSDIASLTLASGFTNSGGFRLDGQSSLTVTGGFTNNTGATLYVDTLSGDGGGGLKIGGTLANTGVVQFGNGNLGAATTVTLGGLTNASGASFSAEGSAGHALQLDFSNNVTGFTSNSGAVELSDIASLTLASGFTNSGGFRLDGQSSLTVTGGFTNNTGATLYVDTLSGDGGGGLKIGGTLTNTGVVRVRQRQSGCGDHGDPRRPHQRQRREFFGGGLGGPRGDADSGRPGRQLRRYRRRQLCSARRDRRQCIHADRRDDGR